MSDDAPVLAFEHTQGGDRAASFLRPKRLAFWVRNTSGSAIHLRDVSVQLQAENAALRSDQTLISRSEAMDGDLPRGARQSVELTVVPPLVALPGSNVWSVRADFEQVGATGVGAPQSECREQFDWINLHDAPAHPDAEVFVSFVDPENDELAQLAELYLGRAGIRPYLAKRDTRIGCDYWEGKIMPAIARAAGMLVIWTDETLRRPDSVIREIEYAQLVGTPVGVFRSHETELPQLYPKSVKEYVGFNPHAPRKAFAHAIAAGAEVWRMTGRFFG
jgi:hypothetical protein